MVVLGGGLFLMSVLPLYRKTTDHPESGLDMSHFSGGNNQLVPVSNSGGPPCGAKQREQEQSNAFAAFKRARRTESKNPQVT